MKYLNILEGELRVVAAPASDYKTTYCLSLAKSVVENGGNVIYYSCDTSADTLSYKLSLSGLRSGIGVGKITIKTLSVHDLTSLRKQIEVDATIMKNLKLIIVDDFYFFSNEYMSNHMFFQDIRGILSQHKTAAVFTTQLGRSPGSHPISAKDIRYSTGAMHLCDSVFAIKTVKYSLKLSLLKRFLNLFKPHHKKFKPQSDRKTYLSVIKNRFGTDTGSVKLLDIDEKSLTVKVNLKENQK